MSQYDDLTKSVVKAGYEVFWYGKTDLAKVKKLESLLNMVMPDSFKNFLLNYGGGGVVGAEVSGIDGDVDADTGGTVFNDTITCRANYGLPDNLIVIYFHDNEVCWCLDTSLYKDGECPVISYSLFSKKIDNKIADTFESFFTQHLSLYTLAANNIEK